jgi:hypothetical protein
MALKKQKAIIVAQWRRNQKEQIRITLDQYHGRNVISLRTWWKNAAGEERAGRDGISLDVSHAPKLAKAFKRAHSKAKKTGLLDDC